MKRQRGDEGRALRQRWELSFAICYSVPPVTEVFLSRFDNAEVSFLSHVMESGRNGWWELHVCEWGFRLCSEQPPTQTHQLNVCMWLIFFFCKKRVVFLCEWVSLPSECGAIRHTEMCSAKSACGNVSRALRLVSGPSINSKATGHCCNKGLRCKSACTCRAYHQIQIPTTTALCKPALKPEENVSTCTQNSVNTLHQLSDWRKPFKPVLRSGRMFAYTVKAHLQSRLRWLVFTSLNIQLGIGQKDKDCSLTTKHYICTCKHT